MPICLPPAGGGSLGEGSGEGLSLQLLPTGQERRSSTQETCEGGGRGEQAQGQI